jgi:prepilin-type N-terminal cleavage/methylation domain-containing protein
MPLSHKAGFTLIEVTVSIFVIGIMMIATAALMRGVPVDRLTRSQSIAVSIAQNKIESLRSAGYASLPANGTSFTDVALSSLTSGSASTSVVTYDTKTKRVDVSVGWVESDQSNHLVTLTSLITSIGGLP